MPDRDLKIIREQVHADIVGNNYGRTNLTKGENKAINRRGWRAALEVSRNVCQYCSTKNALRRSDGLLLAGAQAHLRRKAFSQEFRLVEPRKFEAKGAATTNFVFNILENRDDILLVPKSLPQHRANSLRQTKVGVGVKENQGQRINSTQRAVASFKDMSSTCWTYPAPVLRSRSIF